MLPSLLLIRFRNPRRLWIPVPVLLLWPLWLVGWVVWVVLWPTGLRAGYYLWTVLVSATQLSGLEVDVDSRDGTSIHFRLL